MKKILPAAVTAAVHFPERNQPIVSGLLPLSLDAQYELQASRYIEEYIDNSAVNLVTARSKNKADRNES